MAERRRVVVIGAGMGGLAAAVDLAARGLAVTLLERHAAPGGKMREVKVGDDGNGRAAIDSGPTVFTMRYVFEDLFAAAGAALDERLNLLRPERLARHAWSDGSRLDLYRDLSRSMAAIEAFAGRREAEAYERFARESERIFDTLDHTFMRREKPGMVALSLSLGLRGMPRLLGTRPFTTLWKALGQRFRDPRLRQLFGRYATYCGSSPLQAPATLMLIAHAERAGVWIVDGGMQRLAEALAALATERGAELRYGAEAARIRADAGRTTGVELANGERIDADAVVFNGDVAALNAGLLGEETRAAVPPRAREPRSLSAVTWSVLAEPMGFDLDHHTVFFGENYPDEFDAIFRRGEITAAPTVYVCAQDRGPGRERPAGPERLFFLVNAPPRPLPGSELSGLQQRVFQRLADLGLRVDLAEAPHVVTRPEDFADRFPGTDGAIYGWPTHGATGSFRRWGARSKMMGLYLAGGTVHPGPGVPMAILSGRLAATAVAEDLGA